MKKLVKLAAAMVLGWAGIASAQLSCTYGTKGFQTISYNGTTLMDVGTYPNDKFSTLHMLTEGVNGSGQPDGNVVAGDGEVNQGATWNASTNTETYTFSWGSISWQLGCSGTTVSITSTVTNNAGSGVVFDGLETYIATLHFPSEPNKFYSYSQYKMTTRDPGVKIADYGTGVATATHSDAAVPAYVGWKNVTSQNSDSSEAYSLISTTLRPDGAATFFPDYHLHQLPGTTKTWTNTIRFTSEGTAADVSDITANYAQVYPKQLHWTDRRLIGSLYFSNNPNGSNLDQNTYPNTNNPSGCGASSGNPRNYKNYDGSMDCTDSVQNSVTFQDTVLHRGADAAQRGTALNAQAVVTWDLEGEEYPQATSYVCSPDQIATLAPEMEQIVSDANYPAYNGMKLDDAFFKEQTDAGLKVGVCLRPNIYRVNSSAQTNSNNPSATSPAGSAEQTFPLNSDAGDAATVQVLLNKADYAHGRWGASVFYVDSNVYADGGVLNANVWQQLTAARSNYLFLPETQFGQAVTRDLAYVGNFYNFLDNQTNDSPPVPDLGTPYDYEVSPYQTYSDAFGANLVNDSSSSRISSWTPQLTNAVSKGDVLIAHVDYDPGVNSQIAQIVTNGNYQATNPSSGGGSTSSVPQCPINSGHQCWYVRPDGGYRYNATTGKGDCDGSADLPASGATNHHCAFSSPVWFYHDGSYNGWGNWVGTGGDTYFIRGALKDSVTYRVGYPTQSSYVDANGYNYGVPGDAGGSVIPPPPSGTSSAPTRFLGENYAACTDQSYRTQLHGGWGLYSVMSVKNSSYLDIECLDMTDFSACGNGSGQAHECTSADDFATNAMLFNNQFSHSTIRNVRMHGLTGGINGPTGDQILLDHVDVVGNGGGGWNADNNTVGIGDVRMTNSSISWNGCAEQYPIVDTLPYNDCSDDLNGGYGDGFGTTNTINGPTGVVGQAYTYQWPNIGSSAPAPYTYTADSSTLPPGLTLSSSGVLSGTPTQAGEWVFSMTIAGSNGVSLVGEYQVDIGATTLPQGWHITFDHDVVSYNTQDGLDALHLYGYNNSMTVTNTLAYGSMGSQIKIGGAQAALLNSYAIGNCRALDEDVANKAHMPGLPASIYFTMDLTQGDTTVRNITNVSALKVGMAIRGLDIQATIVSISGNTAVVSVAPYATVTGVSVFAGPAAKLGDFCRAGDEVVPLGVTNGNTLYVENNTIFSNNHIGVDVYCKQFGAVCDTTALIQYNNNVFFGFANGDGEYPSAVYQVSNINPFNSPGSSFSNNATYHTKNNVCPQSPETNALCATDGDFLVKDETWHPYDYGDPTPQTGSPLIASGINTSNITTDFMGNARPNPPTRGIIEPTSTFGPPVSTGEYIPAVFSLSPRLAILLR